MGSVNLSWDSDGAFETFSIYRSDEIIDINNLPVPLVMGLTNKTYQDNSIVVGTTYHYIVAAVQGASSKLSEEVVVLADAPPGDAYFANVVSLNHFNGTDGSSASQDVKPGISWNLSSAKLSNIQTKFGATSLKGNKSRADLTLPSAIGAGDFTIEFWVYPTAASTEFFFSSPYKAGSWFAVGFDGVAKKFITFLAGAGQRVGAETFDLNTWHHVAIVKTAGYSKFYVNGRNIAYSTEPDTKNYTHTLLHIAGTSTSISSSGQWLSGFIDEFRYTQGVARYTENFTPPTIAFPDF